VVLMYLLISAVTVARAVNVEQHAQPSPSADLEAVLVGITVLVPLIVNLDVRPTAAKITVNVMMVVGV